MGNHVICKVEYLGQNIYFSLTRHLLNPKALKVNPFCYCPFKSARVVWVNTPLPASRIDQDSLP